MKPRDLVGDIQERDRQQFIRRHYAVVVLTGAVNNKEYTGIGIAKVCWLDRWSDRKGLLIAEGRARLDIARRAI
jgi:hypothetical protein